MNGLRIFSLLVVLCTAVSVAYAQEFSGSYTLSGTTGTATLDIEQSGATTYAGTLSNEGFDVALNGEVTDGILIGLVDDGSESIAFAAEVQDQQLLLSLVELDAFGQPVAETTQMFLFARAENQSASSQPTAPTGDVTVNGSVLSSGQIAEFESLYGIAPLPGNYWYDAVSGLYGAVGYQAAGFMFPGHDFGQLEPGVSAGNTNVFVNGRELPQAEWLIWSYMLGSAIQIGSYWLDAQGNAGYQGNPIPMVNLYVAAQQNAYAGQGGSGDNFWSSRFSAGNYDSGNTRGYVSVPGHGPVGYGF